ncbi:transcription elongation regulator 1-like protein [Nycticebus coucang]|uniref:transcription elongation regulator 1-like protein n=1 Tax=Nycticebus coucang TaxID=9470 RepID=UPI00234D311B|nr:transcription elongation regulator 1-like protein [Nycticebus coucang]
MARARSPSELSAPVGSGTGRALAPPPRLLLAVECGAGSRAGHTRLPGVRTVREGQKPPGSGAPAGGIGRSRPARPPRSRFPGPATQAGGGRGWGATWRWRGGEIEGCGRGEGRRSGGEGQSGGAGQGRGRGREGRGQGGEVRRGCGWGVGVGGQIGRSGPAGEGGCDRRVPGRGSEWGNRTGRGGCRAGGPGSAGAAGCGRRRAGTGPGPGPGRGRRRRGRPRCSQGGRRAEEGLPARGRGGASGRAAEPGELAPEPPPPPARACRMLAGARFQRRRRQLQQQQQPRRRQPLLWPMNADPPPPPPPPWLWMVPGSAGLLRLGAGVAPPPVLLAAAQPPAAPLLPGLPGWSAPGEPVLPLLPLLPLPSAPDHAAAAAAAHHYPWLSGQWLLGGHSASLGLPPASTVELVPIFPHIGPSALPPPIGKSWINKRIPNCKIFLNNSFALDSAWIHPEELRLFPGHEKPHLLANQVAVSLSRPAPLSRPLPTVVVASQPIPGGCHSSLKPISNGSTIAIAAAAAATMVSVDPEGLRDPSPSSVQPCHFLTLAPIKIPLRTAPFTDKSKELCRAPCPTALLLHTERKSRAGAKEDEEAPAMLRRGEDGATRGSRPVASTPVPGSPWCVVWTGDDRVFFFNPTMQLSVWEKPMDLKDRGDLNRIIEDPPHKRKLEASATHCSDGSGSEDGREDQDMKTKRNRTEGHESPEPEEAEKEDRGVRTPPPQTLLPLEERATHFRDMLLERGVSAFSTWEKELHKIVFDPRYLLLNSEQRKQIFEQFVKTRIKEEYKEKKSKLLLAKEEFRKLLEESKVSPRTTFKEFAEKYGRDQRFRLVQKRKDQEHFFNQFILILKKRDKENRLRLRKMR